MDFKQALIDEYVKNPCFVQSTALWKTFKMTASFDKILEIVNDEVASIIIENTNMLHTYWKNKNYIPEPKTNNNYVVIILNDHCLHEFDITNYSDERYFKLQHNSNELQLAHLNNRFSFEIVDTLINTCLNQIH